MSGSLSGAGSGPIETYVLDSGNEAKQANAYIAGNAEATNLIAYFQKHAAGLTSPAALLGDYKALSVVLGAFNLSQYANSPALVKSLLTQDPTSKSSVAFRSGNAKFIQLASALSKWKPPPFGTPSGVQSIVSAYKNNLFEAAANTQTQGLQNALYFTRQAGSIKTLTQLQSDASLLAVAVTGIGLPLDAFQGLGFDQQTKLLQDKLKISDLQKPSYVKHLAELYLVQQQLANGGKAAAPAAGSVASLFASSGGSASLGQGLLTILQNAEPGGGTSTLLGGSSAGSSLISLFA